MCKCANIMYINIIYISHFNYLFVVLNGNFKGAFSLNRLLRIILHTIKHLSQRYCKKKNETAFARMCQNLTGRNYQTDAGNHETSYSLAVCCTVNLYTGNNTLAKTECIMTMRLAASTMVVALSGDYRTGYSTMSYAMMSYVTMSYTIMGYMKVGYATMSYATMSYAAMGYAKVSHVTVS